MGYALFDGAVGRLSDDILPNDLAQLGERRADERTTNVFRPAIISHDGFRGLCLLRNLSPTGMMARVYSTVASGTSVKVELTADLSTVGTVIWSKDNQIGVRFNDQVNVAEILIEIGRRGPGNKVHRPLRLEIDACGELEIDGRSLTFAVQDISQRGIKVKVPMSLNPNDETMIRINGLEQRKAVVRWTSFGEAGLNFTRPLGMDELATWVVRQQTSRY